VATGVPEVFSGVDGGCFSAILYALGLDASSLMPSSIISSADFPAVT
jgi:hypothetical protein